MEKVGKKRSIIKILAWITLVVVVGLFAIHPSVFALLQSNKDVSEVVSVSDKKLGLAFQHPSRWGLWKLNTEPSLSDALGVTEMIFSKLDDSATYPNKGLADVYFIFRHFDYGKYRYEEVCGYEEVCESIDLLKEKAEFSAKANNSSVGDTRNGGFTYLANIEDSYNVPSGVLIRTVRFYTPDQRVDIQANYDIADLLIARGGTNTNKSLQDIAQEILGKDLHDPINRLSKMYPEDLQAMTEFYKDFDRLTSSITLPNAVH